MSSVWFVIPSKRPLPEVNLCLGAWLDMGYQVACLREPADGKTIATIQNLASRYHGWARSTNFLVQSIMVAYEDAEWFVGGGDDYWPDPNRRADEIADECTRYFQKLHGPQFLYQDAIDVGYFGVMQPTGDRWGEGRCTTCNGTGHYPGTLIITPVPEGMRCPDCQSRGISAVIDRIAGSPWMGREFCRRMYHGAGPMYNGYYHNFADEELQCVARKLDAFWQRRDITQEHRHWATARPRSEGHTGLAGDVRNMPEWARKINDPKLSDWDRSKALFVNRKAAGFPGHEPLEF